MSWRNKIQWSSQRGKASYRGATFYVDTTDTGVGRRTEMHVWPKGKGIPDYVWAKDLGGEPEEFIIEGYVIQNTTNGLDHFPERDRLIQALKTETNKKNKGELVHPFYGKLTVSLVGKARIRESLNRDQGVARFSMTFVQFNEPNFKQQETDFVNLVDTSALGAINAALDSFTDLMNTAGAFLSTLTAPITQIMNNMQGAINSVTGAVASTISTAVGLIATAISLVDNLLSSPCDLANQILNAADAVLGLVGMAGEVVRGGIIGGCSGVTRSSSRSGSNITSVNTNGDIVVLDGTSIPETLGVSVAEQTANSADFTSSDLISVPVEQQNNIELAASIAQTMILANSAKMAIRVEYSSHEQMIETMEIVAESFDNLIDRLGTVGVNNDSIDDIDDPVLYNAVVDLRGNFVNAMLKKYTDLAKQYDYEVGIGVQNALSLAYDKYEDLDRFDDIFNRNRVSIKHPGFLPSGDTIKLLNE